MFIDELNGKNGLADGEKITIFKNRNVFIEDIKTIVSVLDSEIVVRIASKKLVKIIGKNLQISNLEQKTCQISGKLFSIVFEGGND